MYRDGGARVLGGESVVAPLQFFRKSKDLLREESLQPPHFKSLVSPTTWKNAVPDVGSACLSIECNHCIILCNCAHSTVTSHTKRSIGGRKDALVENADTRTVIVIVNLFSK